MPATVQDLGQVTHLLIHELKGYIEKSPRYVAHQFPFCVTGLMPDVSRKDATSTLNLNLLHVGRDPFYRNTPIQTIGAQLNAAQPLSLNLSYLLTSYSENNWHLEQYLMSMALQYFHTHPIYIGPTFEFTITVQADSIEEMSRLWQAITMPIRLSSLFRVAIVFLEPVDPLAPDSRTPTEVVVSVGPDLGLDDPVPEPAPQLYELAMQQALRVPPDASEVSDLKSVAAQPCIVVGQTVRLRGSGLNQANASGVFLSQAGSAAEWPLPEAWVMTDADSSGALNASDEIAFSLDEKHMLYAAMPAPQMQLISAPLPGAYQVTVGDPAGPFRSNGLPFLIGPVATGVTAATTVLAPDSTNTYTFQANGLVSGETLVLLDEISLIIASAIDAGVAIVTVPAGTTLGSISFQLPSSGLIPMAYMQVRFIVNQVEAPPAWWIQVPKTP